MSYLDTQPIRKNDRVKVTGMNTGVDNAVGTVYYVNDLTAMAWVDFKRTRKNIHISKLTIIDRHPKQLPLL